MRQSVRCQAVITPDGVCGNAVISYDGPQLPPHGMALTVMPDNISVMPFMGEIHSTIDYNGIAVVGDMPGISDLSLTVDTLPSVVDRIKSSLRPPLTTIHFIPLG